MKELISEQLFLLRQPKFPEKSPTDPFYFKLANHLADIIKKENLLAGWEEVLYGRVALGLTGYFQDILTDSGIWRSFITENERLYGKWLPFYDLTSSYIPHELNEEDVRFLIWYILCMNCEEKRVFNPLDKGIAKAAKILHEELDKVYENEDTPEPEGFYIWRGLDLKDASETDEVFRFGHWLFMHCYLMTPAFALTLSELLMNPELKNGHNMELLQKTLEDAMMEEPTGPLALFIREWVYLILEGKMPPIKKNTASIEEHPYYTKFVEATGGKVIQFFSTYKELNDFFIKSLGWREGENLPTLKNSRNFVLMVNKEKGMLCASNVADCIKIEGNPCYDEKEAKKHAIELLTIRGRCPGDLLHYIFEHKALPDACFPGTDDCKFVEENQDFIARCYLQKYYLGD